MQLIAYKRKDLIQSQTIDLAGVAVVFHPARTVDGLVMMVAPVPPGGVGDRVLARVRGLRPMYSLWNAPDKLHFPYGTPPGMSSQTVVPNVGAASGKAPVAPLPVDGPLDLRQVALGHGWTEQDLEGTGQNGSWGAEGGLSATTCLSCAQMALVLPPDDWEAKAATHWPWEILGWKPPGQAWVAPAARSKLSGSPQEGAQDEVKVIDPEISAPDEPAQPADETPREVVEAALERFTDEQRQGILAVIVTQVGKAPDKPLTVQRLNYYLGKADLPTVGNVELEALLSL